MQRDATEKGSGSRPDGRTELQVLLDFVQSGDILIVTRIDRLRRSLKDLKDIVHELPGEKDYSSLVSRLKQAGVTVIYLGRYHTEAGLIVRQAREQGLKVTSIGGDALVTNEFWQIPTMPEPAR